MQFALRGNKSPQVVSAHSRTKLEIKGHFHVQARQLVGTEEGMCPPWVLEVLKSCPQIEELAFNYKDGGVIYSLPRAAESEVERQTRYYNNVYSVLVEKASAMESERDEFLDAHIRDTNACEEWRFRGSLGFGGKYYRFNNKVSCYREDLTPDRKKVIDETNEALSGLHP